MSPGVRGRTGWPAVRSTVRWASGFETFPRPTPTLPGTTSWCLTLTMEPSAGSIITTNNASAPQAPLPLPTRNLSGLDFGPTTTGLTARVPTLPSALTSGPITYTASPGMPPPRVGGPPVVVVIQHEGFPPGFGRRPTNCICPQCHLNIVTLTSSKPGIIAWVCCCFLFCVFPFFSPM